MLPWSVIATAAMPSLAVSANSGATFAAPSSMEYSVCTCRCTKDAEDRADAMRDLLPQDRGEVAGELPWAAAPARPCAPARQTLRARSPGHRRAESLDSAFRPEQRESAGQVIGVTDGELDAAPVGRV